MTLKTFGQQGAKLFWTVFCWLTQQEVLLIRNALCLFYCKIGSRKQKFFILGSRSNLPSAGAPITKSGIESNKQWLPGVLLQLHVYTYACRDMKLPCQVKNFKRYFTVEKGQEITFKWPLHKWGAWRKQGHLSYQECSFHQWSLFL